MSSLYHTLFFDPLYNFLVYIFTVIPWADAGVAVVIVTLLVRLILYPLSKKAVVTQARMAEIGPELNAIKEKYKNNSEEIARRTLALYRERSVNPFSGILVIIIQIPIIFALYQIFLQFPEINPEILYSFVSAPDKIETLFLGFVEVGGKSALIAFLAALSTYLQLYFSAKGQKAPTGDSFGDNLTRNMQKQMKYFFPVLVFFISYSISGVIALYWLTTNIFSILQDWFVKKNLKKAS